MGNINQIFPNPKLFVKKINNNIGWGVFTTEKIYKNEIVEICYCMVIHSTNEQFIDYAFTSNDPNNLTDFMPFGYGCIYNHSNIANIDKELDILNKILIFKAIKDIEPEEELCHNYGKGYLERKPLI